MESNDGVRSFSSKYLQIVGYFAIIIPIFIGLIYFFTEENRNLILQRKLHRWYSNEQRIRRPIYINQDHGFCGPCPPEKLGSNVWQLTDLINFIGPKTQFLVNIGAASVGGGQFDPTHPLLITSQSFGALLIDPHSNQSLFDAYPKRNNVLIEHDLVWSESVVERIFQKYNVTKNFALLKIDIDSYECAVLESILNAGYRPDLIHTEFNPIYPPPVYFRPIYDAKTKTDWQPPLWANSGPFYGCSLTALSRLLLKFDYILLQVEFWDVVYIRYSIAHSTSIQVPADDQIAYQSGFLQHSCYSYCKRNRKLYDEHIDRAIKMNLGQSNFTESMIKVMDSYVPNSIKTNLKHPYVIKI